MRYLLASILLFIAASGADAQPLAIERLDTPGALASGDAVEIALTAHVRNVSDSNKRYALAVIVEGAEQTRWTSPAALSPGRAESAPLAWTQAARGPSVRGHVALFNTRGVELAREDFELRVQASGDSRPLTPLPPAARDVITPRQAPRLPETARPRLDPPVTEVRPTAPRTVTPAPMAPRRNIILLEEMRIRNIRHQSLARRAERDVTSCIIEVRIRNDSDEEWGDYSFGYIVRTYYTDGERAVQTHEESRSGFVYRTDPLGPRSNRMFPITVQAPSGSELFQYGRRFRVEVELLPDAREDDDRRDNIIRAEGNVVDEGTLLGSSLRMEPESVVRPRD